MKNFRNLRGHRQIHKQMATTTAFSILFHNFLTNLNLLYSSIYFCTLHVTAFKLSETKLISSIILINLNSFFFKNLYYNSVYFW